MTKIVSIFICFTLLFAPYISGEEGDDDFLDKVNEEKPKKITKKENPKTARSKLRRRKKKSLIKSKNPAISKKQPESIQSNEIQPAPIQKSTDNNWVNEEMEIHPNNVTGLDDVQKKENTSPKEKKIFEFASNTENKPVVPAPGTEKAIETKSLFENIFGSFSDYKKILIIIGFIIVFVIYRIRAGKNRHTTGSPTRGSPRTISNFRKK